MVLLNAFPILQDLGYTFLVMIWQGFISKGVVLQRRALSSMSSMKKETSSSDENSSIALFLLSATVIMLTRGSYRGSITTILVVIIIVIDLQGFQVTGDDISKVGSALCFCDLGLEGK